MCRHHFLNLPPRLVEILPERRLLLQAIVELPHYFAKINKTPSYTLTAVGAPKVTPGAGLVATPKTPIPLKPLATP